MVEEPSMRETLSLLVPKLFPSLEENTHWMILAHQGKKDLEKSILIKLKSWFSKNDKFVILRDNDGGDCKKLKRHLKRLASAWPNDNTLVRIVCQELESWFLGDLAAVKNAYTSFKGNASNQTAKYRTPDKLTNASDELFKLIGVSGKVSRARDIARHLNPDPSQNTSTSYRVFVTGLKRLVANDY